MIKIENPIVKVTRCVNCNSHYKVKKICFSDEEEKYTSSFALCSDCRRDLGYKLLSSISIEDFKREYEAKWLEE